MEITIKLTPDNETRLVAHASAQGITVEHYLNSLIERNLALEAEPPFYETATTEAWVNAFTSWASSHSTKAPPLSDEAISRESIYREREDSQL
jgi:hypothetical protein